MNDKILQGLRLVDLLADLPEPFLKQLAQFSMLRRIRTGETIFCQGEPSPYCFGIISGQVTIQRVPRDKNFPPKILAVLGPGSLFGEQSLFKESPRTAMAIASQDGELIAMQGAQVRGWMEKESASGVQLLAGLLQNSLSRLRQTSHELSLVYGVGRFLATEKPIKERLRETGDFLRASLEDVDEIILYQKNPYWEEFEALVGPKEPYEGAPTLVLPVEDPLVRQVAAVLRPVVVPAKANCTAALVPFLDPEEAQPSLMGFLCALSKNQLAFSPKIVLLLDAVAAQLSEALLRQRRQDDSDARARLAKSRQTYPI